MPKKRIKAVYGNGRSPQFFDLDAPPGQRVKLPNGSVIAIGRLADLRDRANAAIPYTDIDERLWTESFYEYDEWQAMDDAEHRLLGKGLAYLVFAGVVPLKCINPETTSTRIYRCIYTPHKPVTTQK